MQLYGSYSREEVYKYFDPNTKFTPSAGTWGLHGIIKLQQPFFGFVFFITQGASQAGVVFNETIGESGTFEWDSQPSQSFNDITIQHLINRNIENFPIHVFYRVDKTNKKYIYLGEVEYVAHDVHKQCPVHFIWRVIDWDKEKFDKALKTMNENKTAIDSLLIEDMKQISVRLQHCLLRNGIRTISDFLKLSDEDLLRINNLGAKSLEEAKHLKKQYSQNNVFDLNQTVQEAQDDIDPFKNYDISTRARNTISRMGINSENEFAKTDDAIIISQKGCGAQTIEELLNLKKSIINADETIRNGIVLSLIQKVNEEYDDCLICDLFGKSLFVNKLVQKNINTISDFKTTNIEALKDIYFNIEHVQLRVQDYEKPLLENVKETILECLQNKSKKGKPESSWERNTEILKARASGSTLESAVASYGLTRERARQLERKFAYRFEKVLSSQIVYLLLKKSCKHGQYAFLCDLKNIVGEYSDIFLHGLSSFENERIFYIEEYDLLLLDINWYPELASMIEQLPITIQQQEYPRYRSYLINTLAEQHNVIIDADDVDRFLSIEYKTYGTILSRNRLNRSAKYLLVVKKYYEKGINIYDENELKVFRKRYKEMFDEEVEASDRALFARIADCLIIIDRGLYAPKKEKYISDDLKEAIDKYIIEYPRDIIFINNIYLNFEEELKAFGICNKYYLLGVLKECFPGKYYTKRDYLTKTKDASSYYDAIKEFIYDSKRPVSRDDILAEFPGTTDIIISIITSSPEILNLFGNYIHIDNCEIYDDEKDELKKAIEEVVSDNQAHHFNEIYALTGKSLHNLYARIGLANAFGIFSLAYALYKDTYSFKRPYIAKLGVEIQSGKDQLKEYVYSFDEIEISDIQEFARENKIGFYPVVEQIDSYNDEFIFKNKNEIIRISETSFDESIVDIIEKQLSEDMKDKQYMLLCQTTKLFCLPDIGITWNEWVLYSVIKKYSNKFQVFMSDNQFRFSRPVIANKISDIEQIKKEISSENYDKKNSFSEEFDLEKEFLEALADEE